MLGTMTQTPGPPYDDSRIEAMMRIYAENPLRDGDVALLLDDRLCVEVEELAAQWDDVLRRNTAQILRESASRVVVAIARVDAELLPSDYELWRELHHDLRDTGVELLPLRAMPAACGNGATVVRRSRARAKTTKSA